MSGRVTFEEVVALRERLAAAEQRATDADARAADAHATLAALRRREGSTLANKLRRANAEIKRLRGDLTRTVEQWEADSIMLHGAAPATQPDERAAAERATEEAMALFDEDNRYFDERAEQIIARFPEEWVAIYHKTVVGHDLSLDGLMDSLIRDGLPVGTVAVRRATFDPPLFLLALDATDGTAKEES